MRPTTEERLELLAAVLRDLSPDSQEIVEDFAEEMRASDSERAYRQSREPRLRLVVDNDAY